MKTKIETPEFTGNDRDGAIEPGDYSPGEILKRTYEEFDIGGRSLYGHTRFLELSVAKELADFMPKSYNRFSRKMLKEKLEQFDENTFVSFGRESSPVIYFWTKDVTNARLQLEIMQADSIGVIEGSYWDAPDNDNYQIVFGWWD